MDHFGTSIDHQLKVDPLIPLNVDRTTLEVKSPDLLPTTPLSLFNTVSDSIVLDWVDPTASGIVTGLLSSTVPNGGMFEVDSVPPNLLRMFAPLPDDHLTIELLSQLIRESNLVGGIDNFHGLSPDILEGFKADSIEH